MSLQSISIFLVSSAFFSFSFLSSSELELEEAEFNYEEASEEHKNENSAKSARLLNSKKKRMEINKQKFNAVCQTVESMKANLK